MAIAGWKYVEATVWLVVMSSVAIVVASVSGEPWFNPLIRGGFVLNCLTYAITPGIKLLGTPERWVQVRFTGFALSFLLMAVGAFVTWTPVGYLIGSCLLFGGCAFGVGLIKGGLAPWSKLPV